MEHLSERIRLYREKGLTDAQIRTELELEHVPSEQLDALLSTQEAAPVAPQEPVVAGPTLSETSSEPAPAVPGQPVATPQEGGFIQGDLTGAKVDPGYLASFSWGYYGTTIVYAIAMRLGIWAILAPIFYNAIWFLVRIPIGLVVGIVPYIGPIAMLILNTAVPFIILFYLARTVRLTAYQNRTWASDEEFLTVQNAWDFWGKIVFFVLLTVSLILGSITFAAAYKKAQEKKTLTACQQSAISTVYGKSGATSQNFATEAAQERELVTSCMARNGYSSYGQ